MTVGTMAGAAEDDAPPPLRTEVIQDATRSIIARNKSPDISFDQSINPYRGCEHGCIYCFARPTHAYLGMSPGVDFESRLFAKPNAAALLAKELSAPGYVPKVIAMGTNTDPYQPLEKKMRITRSILEVLREFRHPVAIVTKSPLILRDLDILSEMASMGLAKAALSITTLDRKLARAMEPRAGTPGAAAAGHPGPGGCRRARGRDVRARHSGAERSRDGGGAERRAPVMAPAAPVMCCCACPWRSRTCSANGWRSTRPDRAKHVMALVRSMRGGKDYDANWNTRMKGTGPYAEVMARRFHMAVKRLGLNQPGRAAGRPQVQAPCPAWRSARSFLSLIFLDGIACAGGVLWRGQEKGAARIGEYGQAFRRTHDAKDPGPSGCVAACPRGVAAPRPYFRYALRAAPGGSPRRNATQAASI